MAQMVCPAAVVVAHTPSRANREARAALRDPNRHLIRGGGT
jgi:hypothetical protein